MLRCTSLGLPCAACKVVSEPAYSDIMRALLFTSDGMELYLRNPASFNIPTGETSFGSDGPGSM